MAGAILENLNYREIFTLLTGLKIMNVKNPERLKDTGIDYEDLNGRLVKELLNEQERLLTGLQEKGVIDKRFDDTVHFNEFELTTQKLTMDEEYLIAELLGR